MWKRPIGAVVLFYLSLLMLVMGPLVMIYFLVLSTLLVGTMPTGYVTAILLISVLHQVFFAIFREANVIKIGAFAVLPAAFLGFYNYNSNTFSYSTIRQNSWKRNNKKSMA